MVPLTSRVQLYGFGLVARTLRIQYPGAIYHVMNRGDRREAIFEDDEDRERLLQTLTEACEKTGWQVDAYCLRRNHFHPVIEREADLKARRKGEPRKVALAWELRSQTTLPLAWIAERLNLGAPFQILTWVLSQQTG